MQRGFDLSRVEGRGLQSQLVAQLREMILDGRLQAATRMPATRDLALQLGVSRNTVLISYDRLLAEGYLETRGRAGTFVSASLPESKLSLGGEVAAEPSRPSRPTTRPLPQRFAAPILHDRPKERLPYDFRVGRPDPQSFPLRTWRRLIDERLSRAGTALTEYGNPGGVFELRKALVAHLREARGIEADPDQVIIVGGCEEALNIVARMLAPPGTNVFVECPCYRGVAFVFRSYGAVIRGAAIDDEGLLVDDLSDENGGVVCVTPSHQFPIGHTMSLSRRLRLLEWARRQGAYIVEDDYDSDFRYTGAPLRALAALDREGCVIYLGTFSKSIGAGLRIGYLVVPPELVGPAREVKALFNLGNPWLEQVVLAEFISSGSFAQHLRRVRKSYQQRRDALLDALAKHFGSSETLGTEGGMHLTWMLPDADVGAREFQNALLHSGVGVYTIDDGPAFDGGAFPLRDRALFLGYPCLAEKQIVTATQQMARTYVSLRQRRSLFSGRMAQG